MFNAIKFSPSLMMLYTAAMKVRPGVDLSAEGWRQYAHQRIARFIKIVPRYDVCEREGGSPRLGDPDQ